MSKLLACVAVLLGCGIAGAGPSDAPTSPNLVQNPSFEQVEGSGPAGWSAPAEAYSVDATTANTGKRSLRFVNHDPNNYVLCTQQIQVQPGCMYEVKARVKTQGIKGDDSGATVCLEWADAPGSFLGGFYPDGMKGDNLEWVEVGGVSNPVPANAARCTVTCYVRQGMTGRAWWDDVSVRRVPQPAMYATLLLPSYRGLVLGPNPPQARVSVRLVESELKGGSESVTIIAELHKQGEAERLGMMSVTPMEHKQFEVHMPLPNLEAGRYLLSLKLMDKSSGDVIAEKEFMLRRPDRVPKSYVDEHNRLMVDGKPFFPLGMYWSGVSEEELRIYQDSPFNCLMPYGSPDKEQMDLIQRMGLKTFYSIKDYYAGTEWCPEFIKSEADEEPAVRRTVREFRDHPALLAWYINDERPLSMLPRLEAHQKWVEEEDPDHPTWTVLYQVEEVDRYLNSFDVIGTDPYPIPDRPASMAGDWARKTREGVHGSRAVWMVPQVFRWPEKPRPPSYEELRSMTWQCLAEGATGIIFYSWFEIRGDRQFPFGQRWEEVKRVAQEVKEMIPVLLSVEPTPEVTVDGPESVHWTVRSYQGFAYLILVNDSDKLVAATARFPSGPKEITLQGVAQPCEATILPVGLPGFGVSIYRIQL